MLLVQSLYFCKKKDGKFYTRYPVCLKLFIARNSYQLVFHSKLGSHEQFEMKCWIEARICSRIECNNDQEANAQENFQTN